MSRAAFLSTSSGLVMSVAGVVHQDLLRAGRSVRRGYDPRPTSMRGFGLATVVAMAVPCALSLLGGSLSLADTVGLAFAVAASTFCPLLVLGIWWPGLTRTGAVAGLVVGGTLASAAVLATLLLGSPGGWAGALLGQPAAWTVPLSFAVTVLTSLATRSTIPQHVLRTMVRLHAPEDVDLDRGPR